MIFSPWQKKYILLRRAIFKQLKTVENTDNSEQEYKKYCKGFKKHQIGIKLNYESWCIAKELKGKSLEIKVKKEQASMDYGYLINLEKDSSLYTIKKIFKENNSYWKRMKERYSL